MTNGGSPHHERKKKLSRKAKTRAPEVRTAKAWVIKALRGK